MPETGNGISGTGSASTGPAESDRECAPHGWIGLGRIVFAGSIGQLTAWPAEVGAPPTPVRPLSITDVLSDARVEGRT